MRIEGAGQRIGTRLLVERHQSLQQGLLNGAIPGFRALTREVRLSIPALITPETSADARRLAASPITLLLHTILADARCADLQGRYSIRQRRVCVVGTGTNTRLLSTVEDVVIITPAFALAPACRLFSFGVPSFWRMTLSERALTSAGRRIKERVPDAVELEAVANCPNRRMSHGNGIAVVAHSGLTKSVAREVVSSHPGQTVAQAMREYISTRSPWSLGSVALILGVFADRLADRSHRSLEIPTIGIGPVPPLARRSCQ